MIKYEIKPANSEHISKLIKYKLGSIIDYAENLPKDELDQITSYVKESIPSQLKDYKVIYLDNELIGCLFLSKEKDGILLDDIYLEENYRNKGIGTSIIKEVILQNKLIYLWVYKKNNKAISLYKKLGFQVIEETDSRYYMRYVK